MSNQHAVTPEVVEELILSVFPENMRAEVVGQVIDRGRDGNSPVRWYREAIGRTRIPGFRPNSPSIPDSLLVQRALSIMKNRDEAVVDVAMCWARVESRFVGRVRRFAKQDSVFAQAYRALVGGEIVDLDGQIEAIDSALVRYINEYPDAPAETARLALGCTLAKARLRTRQAADEEADTSGDELSEHHIETSGKAVDAWERLLAVAAEWSPEAPQWDAADAFVDAVRRLAQQKLAARVVLAQGELRAALERLGSDWSEVLSSLGVCGVEGWLTRPLAASVGIEVLEVSTHLLSLLDQRKTILDEGWSTPDERRLWTARLDETEEEIKAACQQIDSAFSKPDGDKPGSEDSGPGARPSESKSDVGQGLSSDERGGQEAQKSECSAMLDEEIVPEAPEEESLTELADGEVVAPHAEQQVGEVETVTPDGTGPAPSSNENPETLEGDETFPLEEIDAGGGPRGQASEPIEVCVESRPRPEESEIEKERLLWELIRRHDLPGAYWLAAAMEGTGHSPRVDSKLLAALQAARWLDPDNDRFVAELARWALSPDPENDAPLQLLRTAAGLVPALTAPSTGLAAWLHPPAGFPEFHELVEVVIRFSHEGVGFRPEDLEGVSGKSAREAQISAIVKEAKARLETASSEKVTFAYKANEVWRTLHAREEEQAVLRALLEPVSFDKRAKLEAVQAHVANLSTRDEIVELLYKVQHRLGHKRSQQIVNAPLEHLVRAVERTVALAEKWCSLVARERQIAASGDWLYKRALQMRGQIQPLLPGVRTAVEELLDQPSGLASAGECLRVSVAQVSHLLGAADSPADIEPQGLPRGWWLEDRLDIRRTMAKRLKLVPALSEFIDDDGMPKDLESAPLLETLAEELLIDRPFTEVLEGWIRQKDYRFFDGVVDAIPDEADRTEWTRRFEAAVSESQYELQRALAITRDQVERALLNGLIEGSKRAEYLALVDTLRDERHRSFGSLFRELEAINAVLIEEAGRESEQLKDAWIETRGRLAEKTDEVTLQAIDEFLDSAFDAGETRVVRERIAQITEALERGSELPSMSPRSLPVASYLRRAERLRSWSRRDRSFFRTRKAIDQRQTVMKLAYGELPSTQAEQASAALEAWSELKQMPVKDRRKDAPQCLRRILQFLNFRPQVKDGAITVEENKPEWLHARSLMSAGGLAAPFPDFGSMAGGRYELAVLWERQDADTLAALLRDGGLDKSSLILFYLGSLTPFQLNQLAEVSRENGLAVAILDEPLLLHLSALRKARLPEFLACTLPYSGAKPYKPSLSAYVPPEIFFGRDSLAKQLTDPAGTCLVYGGRQMGKSALLRHVQEAFTRPDDDQHAWVIDIPFVGRPGMDQEPETLWRLLRDQFVRSGLMESTRTYKSSSIVKLLGDAMRESPNRRVLAMFDEADYFLTRDAENNFEVVTGLRTLMNETSRRFKVVFAGLHRVQRFHGIPNQPLAHFGTPVLVGPLEPSAAEELIRRPLEALGFELSPEAVLQILSYTNYHPGLLQLFCDELLNRLYERYAVQSPVPAPVTTDDTETVYLRESVRATILDRFDLTLNLDPRYKAIVWSMVVDQMARKNGYADLYGAAELRRLASGYWEAGFQLVGMDEFRGLLDELRDLGILVRTSEGQYRLRSPNIVHLFGGLTTIEDRLLELGEHPPEMVDNPESHHALLDYAESNFSPLTYSQARVLNGTPSGVGLIFGSEALGLSGMDRLFASMIPSDQSANDEVGLRTLSSRLTGNALRQHLRDLLKRQGKRSREVLPSRIIAHQMVEDCSSSEIVDRVNAALEVCRSASTNRTELRVIFVFGPNGLRSWLNVPAQEREDLENKVGAVIHLRRWNMAGIRQRLQLIGKVDTDDACLAVFEATDGWPWLMDEVIAHSGKDLDPRPAATVVREGWYQEDGELRKKALGLYPLERQTAEDDLLRRIAQEGSVPKDLLVPEILNGEEREMDSEDIQRATQLLEILGLVNLDPEDGYTVEPITSRLVV